MNPQNENNNKQKEKPEFGLFDLFALALKDLADLLRDLRFAAIVLVITAFATLFGTVLPQTSAPHGTTDPQIVSLYGENLFSKVIKPLGLDRVFTTAWYHFVLLLLVASVTLCALARTKAVLALSRQKSPITSEKGIKSLKFSETRKFRGKDDSVNWASQQLKKHNFSIRMEEKDNAVHIIGRKNIVSKWMLVVMHYSFLFILIGAIIGSLFGWKDFVKIREGEKWDLPNKKGAIQLVDYWEEFDAKDNPDELSYFMGMPSDYKAKLQMLDENGTVKGEKIIEVNNPLDFGGFKYYQTSWEFNPILAIFKNGELENRWILEQDKPFSIGDEMVLMIPSQQIISGFKIIRNKDGSKDSEVIPPTCIIYEVQIHEENKEGETHVEPLSQAGGGTGIFKKGEKLDFNINGNKYELVFEGMREYTVLEVKRDPGVGIVFFGFLLCVIGATWGLLAPYGIIRALVVNDAKEWKLHLGTSITAVGESIRKSTD